MTDQEPSPVVSDEVPWSDRMTEYDDRHCETYIRLLDAAEDGMTRDDMARRILGIDPAADPERAGKAVESHLARALDERSRLPLPRRRRLSGRRKPVGRAARIPALARYPCRPDFAR